MVMLMKGIFGIENGEENEEVEEDDVDLVQENTDKNDDAVVEWNGNKKSLKVYDGLPEINGKKKKDNVDVDDADEVE